MALRENRFVLGILFPIIYEIGLIETYLFFMANRIELFLFLPTIFLIFPSYMYYLYSPNLILKVTKASEKYYRTLCDNLDEIFYLDTINLEETIKYDLTQNIRKILLPELKLVYERGYFDSYFTRNEALPNERMCSFRETLLLFSVSFGFVNIVNFFTIIYLHYSSISLDFLYIDQIVNLQNVLFFTTFFFIFVVMSIFLFLSSRKAVVSRIDQISYNLESSAHSETFKDQSRHIELESIRKFPLEDKLGRKLAGNWDLVSKLYFEFIEGPLQEEIQEFSQREVARTLVLKQYSKMLSTMDLSPEKRQELELQFYLGQEITGVIEELVSTEEETESIKIDILYTRKKLETWEGITNDEQISTFLYLWRSVESLFRHALWKRDKYPKDDQSWLSIMNSLMRERLITVKENKKLKIIRQRRNGLLHRSQDRFVHKEDIEDLLAILENVLDKV